MTEPDAQPPRDPAKISPIEQLADLEPRPVEFQLSAGEPSLPPPVPAPLPPPYSSSHSAPLPPPYSPPPRNPSPPPFEPEPPFTPPPPPISPPYSGGSPIPPTPSSSGGAGWAAAAHWTSLFGLGFSCLLVGLIGPWIVWLAKKDQYAEADWHGRESLNFQMNMLLVWIVALPLYCCCGLGLIIHLLQPIYMIVLVVFASIEALSGKRFRYPFTLRLLND